MRIFLERNHGRRLMQPCRRHWRASAVSNRCSNRRASIIRLMPGAGCDGYVGKWDVSAASRVRGYFGRRAGADFSAGALGGVVDLL
ncbi:hypothetical protein AGR3A_Cc160042 [Agrobacterium tomkonis CFBP 6623]|uniref:Uncharacterized protein n=1 Tax=Agrobacterium tomkonis CFBP 6623 TaxID=1183432 RepID=A0A1S7NRN2_9HYPH|nr:hypothetical protein AGR3A_Cc160042 [Agrobacterium tomkonis CFBP 6623]